MLLLGTGRAGTSTDVWVLAPYMCRGPQDMPWFSSPALTTPHCLVTVVHPRHLETVRGGMDLGLAAWEQWPFLSPPPLSPSARGGLLTPCLGGCRVAEGLFPQWPLSEPINVYIRLINNSGWQLSREEGNLCAHSQGRLRQEPGELFVQMEQQGGSDS